MQLAAIAHGNAQKPPSILCHRTYCGSYAAAAQNPCSRHAALANYVARRSSRAVAPLANQSWRPATPFVAGPSLAVSPPPGGQLSWGTTRARSAYHFAPRQGARPVPAHQTAAGRATDSSPCQSPRDGLSVTDHCLAQLPGSAGVSPPHLYE